MKRFLPVILLIAMLISACSPAVSSRPEATTAAVPGPASSAYPPGETAAAGAYPPPATVPPAAAYPGAAYPGIGSAEEFHPTQGAAPSPDSVSGVVKGRVLLRGKPLHDITFYLAKIIKDEAGQESVASFSRVNSPRAYPDAEGNFVFAGIQPGEYSLVVDFVLGNVLLGGSDGRGPMIFAVEAGKTLDLGTLDYPDLAIPNQ